MNVDEEKMRNEGAGVRKYRRSLNLPGGCRQQRPGNAQETRPHLARNNSEMSRYEGGQQEEAAARGVGSTRNDERTLWLICECKNKKKINIGVTVFLKRLSYQQ